MGAAEVTIWNQLKKNQVETNERFEALIAQQKITNQLLSRIADALDQQAAPSVIR